MQRSINAPYPQLHLHSLRPVQKKAQQLREMIDALPSSFGGDGGGGDGGGENGATGGEDMVALALPYSLRPFLHLHFPFPFRFLSPPPLPLPQHPQTHTHTHTHPCDSVRAYTVASATTSFARCMSDAEAMPRVTCHYNSQDGGEDSSKPEADPNGSWEVVVEPCVRSQLLHRNVGLPCRLSQHSLRFSNAHPLPRLLSS